MKKFVILSSVFLFLSVASCQKQSDERTASGYTGSDQTIKKIALQLLRTGIPDRIITDLPDHSLKWEELSMYGSVGDSLAHALLPVSDVSGTVYNFIHIRLKGKDSLVDARMISYQKDYLDTKDTSSKAQVARDLMILSVSKRKLPAQFSVDSAKKLLSTVPGLSLRHRNETGSTENLRGNTSCTMVFHIDFLISSSWYTVSQVNSAFFGLLYSQLNAFAIYPHNITTDMSDDTYVVYNSNYISYAALETTISSVWNQTRMTMGVETLSENYQDHFCNGEESEQPVPTTEDPNPDICDEGAATLQLNHVFNTMHNVYAGGTIADLVYYTENGINKRKRKMSWDFYRGDFLYFHWYYTSVDTAIHKQTGPTGTWRWAAFNHGSELTTGSIPYSITMVMRAATGKISTDSLYASMKLEYTVKGVITCFGQTVTLKEVNPENESGQIHVDKTQDFY